MESLIQGIVIRREVFDHRPWIDLDSPHGERVAWQGRSRPAREPSAAAALPVFLGLACMIYLTILLLTTSNVFMTLAWYGHLKHKQTALWAAIIVSWMIAFVEYCFQVPANRLGHNAGISAAQLKTIQEVITLGVFCVFSVQYLHEPLKWNYLVGFLLIVGGALFVFAPWQAGGAG